MNEKDNQRLPKLNPLITLSQAPSKTEGSPVWTLHNPVSNAYFRIDWAEFECLARFSQHEIVRSLIDSVNAETTLEIDEDDIESLIFFLNQKGLLMLSDQKILPAHEKPKSIWEKILHGYLFFTLPLIRPEFFLQRTLPYIRPLLSRRFILIMMAVLITGFFVTLQRADEFLHTFTNIFSAAGLVMGLFVFAGLKIVHELAHAYTATKYGVRVPHMGVAFIVMYPVLYTETTGSWQLSSRRQRLHIGLAGILAELCLAGVFLWVWNIAPSGSLTQSLAFTAVAISLIGSLLVNLNPLMRFDGYYMLCDITGLDNLQSRACGFARWKLRRILFSLQDPPPEEASAQQKRFLTLFGFALLIYRFFLFLGIAFLVYALFPKPLGAFLMAVELLWFIGIPIWSELKIWHQKHTDILKTPRTRVVLSLVFTLALLSFIPWQRTISIPAMAHAAEYASLYASSDAYVERIFVKEGQNVKAGETLAQLSAPKLEKDLKKAHQALISTQDYRRRISAAPAQARLNISMIDAEIETQKQALQNLQKQKKQLNVTAPFSGQIRDFNPALHAGRSIQKTDLLFRVIEPRRFSVTAYVAEHDLERITQGSQAVFMPKSSPFTHVKLRLQDIDKTNVKILPWPALSSIYGGPLATSTGLDNPSGQNQVELLQGVFALHLQPTEEQPYVTEKYGKFSQIGTVRIQGRPQSAIMDILRSALALFIRESGLN